MHTKLVGLNVPLDLFVFYVVVYISLSMLKDRCFRELMRFWLAEAGPA